MPLFVPAVAPASPNKSVAFNKSGAFGGDAGFLYDFDAATVNLQAAIYGGNGFTGPIVDGQNGVLYDTGLNANINFGSSPPTMIGLWNLDYDKIVNKLTDETVASSTVLQNDDNLQIVIDDTGIYQFEIVAFATANVAAGIKATVNGPILGGGFIAYNVNIVSDGALKASSNKTSYDQGVGFTAATADIVVIIRGSTNNIGNTGPLIFRWCQNTSNAAVTTVKAGSYMKVRRIA